MYIFYYAFRTPVSTLIINAFIILTISQKPYPLRKRTELNHGLLNYGKQLCK